MSIRSKKRRSSKRTSRSTPKSKAQSTKGNRSYRFSLGQKVKTTDSFHAHIMMGMEGVIEDILQYGYGVHFEGAKDYAGKNKPVTVFMLPCQIAAIAETDEGGAALVTESRKRAVRRRKPVQRGKGRRRNG